MKMSSGAGSSIRKFRLGHNYGRTDRPGVFTLLRLESSEAAQVREFGSGNIDVVPLSVLAELRNLPTADRSDLKEMEQNENADWNTAQAKFEAIKSLIPLKRVSQTLWDDTVAKTGFKQKRLRSWLRAWQANPVMSSLMRKRRSDAGSKRLDPWVEEKLTLYLDDYVTKGDMQLTDVLAALDHDIKAEYKRTGRILVAPALSTLHQRVTSFSEIDKAEGRIGAKRARQKHGLYRGSLLDIDHPLSNVQCDHLELPVIVVDAEFRFPIRRAWITVLIDLFSRMICGYYITLESPGNLSLGLAITHAILPKAETLNQLPYEATWPVAGLPWQLHADNAGEFQGNMLEWACMEYEFEIAFRKCKEPQYGGHIESYLGTLSGQLRHLGGSTREGPGALGEKNPSELATMTLAELGAYILNLIIEYHGKPHSGLGGMTPLAKFQEGMRGTASTYPVGDLLIPADPVKLMLDFLPAIERVIGPAGVVIDYIWYMDDVLQRWVHAKDPKNVSEARQFLFRRDPRDLSRIYFWDPEQRCYHVIPTRNLLRESISLWEYSAVRLYMEEKGETQIDEDLIFNAREERRRLIAESASKTKLAKNAREAERIKNAKEGATGFENKVNSTASESYKAPRESSVRDRDPAAPAVDLAIPATPFVMNWED